MGKGNGREAVPLAKTGGGRDRLLRRNSTNSSQYIKNDNRPGEGIIEGMDLIIVGAETKYGCCGKCQYAGGMWGGKDGAGNGKQCLLCWKQTDILYS